MPTRDLYRIANMPHFYNTKGKETSGSIRQETRDILRPMFEPYNIELAHILNDENFNFNNIRWTSGLLSCDRKLVLINASQLFKDVLLLHRWINFQKQHQSERWNIQTCCHGNFYILLLDTRTGAWNRYPDIFLSKNNLRILIHFNDYSHFTVYSQHFQIETMSVFILICICGFKRSWRHGMHAQWRHYRRHHNFFGNVIHLYLLKRIFRVI